MVSEINVRFAMDTWGIMFQTNGVGRDYELLPGQTSGELVEIEADGAKSCSGESSSMQCG